MRTGPSTKYKIITTLSRNEEVEVISIENGWAKGLTLDRIDNNKGYSPDNCRWVTRLQQCYNKTNNILYNYGGIEIPLGMIAKLEDVKYGLLYTRVKQKGMSINEAIADIKKSGS